LLEGEGYVGADNTVVKKDQVAFLTHDDTTSISEVRMTATSKEPLKALLFGGLPIGEPVVAKGPFVMNTREEIKQAYADYQAGLFGI